MITIKIAFVLVVATFIAPSSAGACSGFMCSDGSKCVRPEYKCDGRNDCADGSDEAASLCAAPSGITCPNKDDLSNVIAGNYLRTPDEMSKANEDEKRNIVIFEVEKITGHTTKDLQSRANTGQYGSLTSVANMAFLLIKYKYKCRSDVKTMTYDSMRNTIISEFSKLFSRIDLIVQKQIANILQSMTDHQLLKEFCKVYSYKTTTTTTPTITCPELDSAAAADFTLKALDYGIIMLQYTKDNFYENEGVNCFRFKENSKHRDSRARFEKTYNNGRFLKEISNKSGNYYGQSNWWFCCLTQEAALAKGYTLDD